jgi:hypothetical protein
MDGSKHRVNLINRGGYLHEKYRVPPQLIEELLIEPVILERLFTHLIEELLGIIL